MVELNGNVYLIYSVGYGQTVYFNLNVAVAYNTTIAAIVTGYEGALNTPINQSQPNGAPYSGVNQPIQQYDVGTGTNANPIAGNWTPLATSAGYAAAQRSSNTIIGSTAGDICDSYDNSTVWGADQWASVMVKRPASTTSQVGISLRQNTSGAATAYRFYWTYSSGSGGVGTWFIDKLVAGVTTNLATGALTVSDNDVLMAAVVGTNLMFFYNGLQFVAVTDTSISSGAAGFALMPVTSTANAVLQNWQGGSFRNPANGTGHRDFYTEKCWFQWKSGRWTFHHCLQQQRDSGKLSRPVSAGHCRSGK